MKSYKIQNDLLWVGALDPELRVFDIIMNTPYGTTYNSYVIIGSEKTAVFETVKSQFFDQYIERLKEANIDLKKIDYLVVSHTEPDHAGSVERMIELCPNISIVASPTAIKYLKKVANKDFKYIEATQNSSISLGDKTLEFISAPFLHWPDTIYTYVKELKTLITCDSFGAHYCTNNIFDDSVENYEDYMDALKYYYDCIFGPFKSFVLKALDKIKDLEINYVCTGHGPVLRKHIQKVISLYKEWSTPQPKNEKPKVVVCYVSAYGYTETLAKEISKSICENGDIDLSIYDVINHDKNYLLDEINSADGILFGTPTINSDMLEPIRDLLTHLNPLVHGGKIAAVFGSYGWSGEGIPNTESRLKELKMNLLTPSLKINFKPCEKELKDAQNFGRKFKEKLLTSLNK
ncbi:FprA family A-type flavoprotein [Candidatus Arthromitus sp. SFB-rat-Yit]|uniref:FprA family A-type flavoprotein n=1 Tax=Candidatus Arthromitus sp. SFB-rat-Yit TaxID=1041504 RepID=UPI000227A6B1|nr:FprA family A-type flavoprotein [Candidatus Arthromitus sp. SFB-rat-Yit]BAK80622.1 metallo-beta-lactamase family flavodoxin [Candidatus Arthromitus sp. SFB-rat-Yit]